MPTTPPRPRAQILAELAEVRRHLREAPPHSGAGTRERLATRLRALERELAASDDGRAASVPPPQRRPGDTP